MKILKLRISEDDLYDMVFSNFRTNTFEEFTDEEWSFIVDRWFDLAISFKEEALDHLEDIVIEIAAERGYELDGFV